MTNHPDKAFSNSRFSLKTITTTRGDEEDRVPNHEKIVDIFHCTSGRGMKTDSLGTSARKLGAISGDHKIQDDTLERTTKKGYGWRLIQEAKKNEKSVRDCLLD